MCALISQQEDLDMEPDEIILETEDLKKHFKMIELWHGFQAREQDRQTMYDL